MKQYVSVFMLTLRSVHKKIAAILAVMAAAEAVCFRLASGPDIWLEDAVVRSAMPWFFAAAAGAVTVVLCRALNGSGRQEYTLLRLAVSERAAFWIQAASCILCYLLLWALQVLTALLLVKISAASLSPAPGHLAFLAFYRSTFLHNLFPLENLACWVRNLMLAAGLGISAAWFSHSRHCGKFTLNILFALGLSVLAFTQDLGNQVMVWITAAAAAANVYVIYLAAGTEEPYEPADISLPEEVQ